MSQDLCQKIMQKTKIIEVIQADIYNQKHAINFRKN